jgi:hypothetical protein
MYELKKGWFLSIVSLLVKRSVKKRMFDGTRGNESSLWATRLLSVVPLQRMENNDM